MNKLKELQQSFIVEEAIKMFFARPISEVTMSDIAKEIGIGEATLYRYFGKKSNIVLRAAEKLSLKVINEYFKVDLNKNGFERIKDFYQSYLNIFIDNRNYYSFIYHFDSFIISENNMDLTKYNDSIVSYKKIFDLAFETGLKDGSIKFDGDVDLFYRATTLSLLNLCKKLAIEENLLKEDERFEAANEIKALIEIFLFRINK